MDTKDLLTSLRYCLVEEVKAEQKLESIKQLKESILRKLDNTGKFLEDSAGFDGFTIIRVPIITKMDETKLGAFQIEKQDIDKTEILRRLKEGQKIEGIECKFVLRVKKKTKDLI